VVGDRDLALDAGEAVPVVCDVHVPALRGVEQRRPGLEHVVDGVAPPVPVGAGLVLRGALRFGDGREHARGHVRVRGAAHEDGRRGRPEERVPLEGLCELPLDVLQVVGDGVGLLLGQLPLDGVGVPVESRHVLVEPHPGGTGRSTALNGSTPR
jgi:hypothetical protein